MWISKIAQKPKVVANLTWVGFMKLLLKRFMPEYQDLLEGMNLVQIRLTRPFHAYVVNLNAQMNATLKINKFGR